MSLSQPEFAAEGKTIGALVYFSSASENTARFVAGCRLQDEGINVYRIPLRAADPALNVREPYVIMVPTYGGGVVKKAVPIQVKRFLNDPANREWIRGAIASGNTNSVSLLCRRRHHRRQMQGALPLPLRTHGHPGRHCRRAKRPRPLLHRTVNLDPPRGIGSPLRGELSTKLTGGATV